MLDFLGSTIGEIIIAIGGWEAIQFFLNKFFFEKKKNKNEDKAGEIANNRQELDIMRDLNTVLNETVGRLQERLDASEKKQEELAALIHESRKD